MSKSFWDGLKPHPARADTLNALIDFWRDTGVYSPGENIPPTTVDVGGVSVTAIGVSTPEFGAIYNVLLVFRDEQVDWILDIGDSFSQVFVRDVDRFEKDAVLIKLSTE